eukprot:1329327-Prymnesium_polylepis.1
MAQILTRAAVVGVENASRRVYCIRDLGVWILGAAKRHKVECPVPSGTQFRVAGGGVAGGIVPVHVYLHAHLELAQFRSDRLELLQNEVHVHLDGRFVELIRLYRRVERHLVREARHLPYGGRGVLRRVARGLGARSQRCAQREGSDRGARSHRLTRCRFVSPRSSPAMDL